MKLEIEFVGHNDFTVRMGDRYQDRLCWDEMLGCVARVTLNTAANIQGLRTAEEHAKSPYSSLSQDRLKEECYKALCGVDEKEIALANEAFSSCVAQRLAFLLNCARAAEYRAREGM